MNMVGGSTRSASKTDDDNIEKLMNKVCSNFASQMQTKLDEKFQNLEYKINQLCESFETVKQSVQKNTKAIDDIRERIEIMEQHNKRNSVRLCGLQETQGEQLDEVVSALFADLLKVPCTPRDIDYIFRSGKGNLGENRSRPIVINFLSNRKRCEVYNAKKLLKSSEMSLYEDLTLSRYETLMAAKKKYGKTNVWSAGGKIYYWDPKGKNKVLLKQQ